MSPPTTCSSKKPGADRLAKVTELKEEDLNLVASFIDALAAKTRLEVLASGS